MKRCAGKCGKVKPLDDFHVLRTSKDGRRVMCKVCRAQYNRRPVKREGTIGMAPVLVAVRASGLTVGEIAARAGRDPETVRRTLARDAGNAVLVGLILAAIDVLPTEIGV